MPAHFLFDCCILDLVVLHVFDIRATRDQLESLDQEDLLGLVSLDQRLWPDNFKGEFTVIFLPLVSICFTKMCIL